MSDTPFFSNVILLLLTAGISGFLIPFMLKEIDRKRTKEIKRREADVARQRDIITAQSRLIEAITIIVWRWRYNAVRVSYCGAEFNDQVYDNALKCYRADIWEQLNEFRCLVSTSRRLAGEQTYLSLLTFYNKIVDIDRSILVISRLDNDAQRSISYCDLNQHLLTTISNEIDDLILKLSNALGLSSKL